MNLISIITTSFLAVLIRGNPLITEIVGPCMDRYNQVMQELHETGDISSEPRYVPRCHQNGIQWQVAQCTELEQSSCFCVDPATGIPREDTRTTSPNLKILACDPRPCQHLLYRYQSYVAQQPLLAETPFGYEPSCQINGKFEAMQRNEFVGFCVDTKTGEKVPDTDYHTGVGNPITERICQAYSQLWQRYKEWLEDNEMEDIDQDGTGNPSEGSCTDGFEFHSCSCKNLCIPGTNMNESTERCEYCTPVCKCPSGSYEYNATCVTNEVCSSLQPEPFTMNIKGTLWNTYMLLNGNDILKSHWESSEDLNEDDDDALDDEDPEWVTTVHRISDSTKTVVSAASNLATTKPNTEDTSTQNRTSTDFSPHFLNRLRLMGYTNIGKFFPIPNLS